jgi:hypothetical protein
MYLEIGLSIAGLALLMLLLTGPGLWSEKSGWWIARLRRRGPKDPPRP